MATKLKVVEDVADIVPAPQPPQFDIAPTRKQHAGWTAERQRRFIEHLSLTGNVGEACAVVGVASSSAYRLRNKAGAESFARAWDAALRLCPTRSPRSGSTARSTAESSATTRTASWSWSGESRPTICSPGSLAARPRDVRLAVRKGACRRHRRPARRRKEQPARAHGLVRRRAGGRMRVRADRLPRPAARRDRKRRADRGPRARMTHARRLAAFAAFRGQAAEHSEEIALAISEQCE